jgi:hypothetical protein
MGSSPLVHSVHFYDHDEALVSRLHNIVVSSLEGGSSVLIVATKEHRRQLAAALKGSERAVEHLTKDRLQMLDARETLSKFMLDGHPSHKRFVATVGKLLADARSRANNEHLGLTVFGEMVALLWSDRNEVGALELERMWNEALHDRSFHLHCAYPRWILEDNANNLVVKAICDEHSSVFGYAPRIPHPASIN